MSDLAGNLKPQRKLPHHSVVLAGIATALSLMGDQAMYVILPTCYNTLLTSFSTPASWAIPTWLKGPVWTVSPELQVGILLSANRWIRMGTNHLAEWLVHHFHPSLLFVLMLGLGALTTASYGVWPFFWVLLIARCGWGLCWSIIRQVGIMTAVDASTREHAAGMVGFYNGLARFGSVIAMLIGGWLFDSVGWRMCFWIIAGVTALGMFPAAIARRKVNHHESEFRLQRDMAVPAGKLWSLLICGFVVGCAGAGIVMSTVGKVLKEGLGDTLSVGTMTIGVATVAGVFMAGRHAINTFGGPALGVLSDRMGHRRGGFTFFGFGTGVLLMIYALSFLIPNGTAMLGILVLTILFFSCCTLLSVTMNAEASRCGSKAYARYVSAEDGGSAAGPLLIWALLGWNDHPAVPFACASVFFIIGLVVAFGRMARRKEIPVDA
jgi:MFS family permease